MNYKICLIFLTVFLNGCVSNRISTENLLPRYVSPLLYLDYTCEEMRLANKDFQGAKITYSKIGKANKKYGIKYKSKNAIIYSETKLDQLGQSVLLGHEIALNKAAELNKCIL